MEETWSQHPRHDTSAGSSQHAHALQCTAPLLVRLLTCVSVRCDTGTDLHARRVGCVRAKEEPYIASMGIYVAKASAIRDLLIKHFPEV